MRRSYELWLKPWPPKGTTLIYQGVALIQSLPLQWKSHTLKRFPYIFWTWIFIQSGSSFSNIRESIERSSTVCLLKTKPYSRKTHKNIISGLLPSWLQDEICKHECYLMVVITRQECITSSYWDVPPWATPSRLVSQDTHTHFSLTHSHFPCHIFIFSNGESYM